MQSLNEIEKPDEKTMDGANVVSFPRTAMDMREPPGENWLWKLPVGTHFLAQQASPYLLEAILRAKSDKAVWLEYQTNQGTWVDPVTFSNHYKLFEILQVLE